MSSISFDLHFELEDNNYNLSGFAVHQGSLFKSGHYYAYIQAEDLWYKADDRKVSQLIVLFYAHSCLLECQLQSLPNATQHSKQYCLICNVVQSISLRYAV